MKLTDVSPLTWAFLSRQGVRDDGRYAVEVMVLGPFSQRAEHMRGLGHLRCPGRGFDPPATTSAGRDRGGNSSEGPDSVCTDSGPSRWAFIQVSGQFLVSAPGLPA